ncbi:hypothetical protein PBCV1_a341aR [Paramecium bursaria Chlorella virus 1]|uniref:Uncharacterized protein n=1 Tax=Paramecium bursaria Chlorella virus 1 TaxID=10506 RepID=Q84655_PBCV1|nr:hypothetical protein PBCV1_a341aR [Paramecium bursaria Chlorella virus 1]AAC96709.2 hypothetical protein [Paramecium bursaria Chlorella virus 1]
MDVFIPELDSSGINTTGNVGGEVGEDAHCLLFVVCYYFVILIKWCCHRDCIYTQIICHLSFVIPG